MDILPLLILLVFGPTQYGKTTFIKRLGGTVLETRTEAGRSVTSSLTIYNFNLTWPDDDSIQPVSIIDLPGLDDTELVFSNDFIGETVRVFLSQRKDPKIDAFLVFNSLGESSTKVKNTLSQLTEALLNVTSSVVMILSKADLADTNTPGLKKTVIKDCKNLHVKYVEWTDIADSDKMKSQLVKLRKAISQVTPFTASSIEKFEDEIKKRAEFLREKDNGGFLKVNITVNVTNVKEFEDFENLTIAEKVARYSTSEELLAKAQELQKIGLKEPVLVTVQVMKKLTESVPVESSGNILNLFEWKSYDIVTTHKDVLVNETRIEYVDKDISFYVNLLKEEVETKFMNTTRVIKGSREVVSEEQREIEIEKHSFEYYINEARIWLINEIWAKLREKAKENEQEIEE